MPDPTQPTFLFAHAIVYKKNKERKVGFFLIYYRFLRVKITATIAMTATISAIAAIAM